MSDFTSLSRDLEGYFDKELDKLPDALRECVLRLFPMPWGRLSPDLRRSMAAQLDALNGPTNEQSRQSLKDQILAVDMEIEKWVSTDAKTPEGLDRQDQRLMELRQKRSLLEKPLIRGDYPELDSKDPADNHTKPRNHLDHDPEWQARANQIAAEQRVKTGRSITKGKVANILATELKKKPDTVERRIRKEWK